MEWFAFLIFGGSGTPSAPTGTGSPTSPPFPPTSPVAPNKPSWSCSPQTFQCVSDGSGMGATFASQDECEKQCSTCQACFRRGMKCISAPSVYDWKQSGRILQTQCCPDRQSQLPYGCTQPVYDSIQNTCKQTCTAFPVGWKVNVFDAGVKEPIP